MHPICAFIMADLDSTRATPLHPGVDAQSWLGFEQRIQLRRFDALLGSARQAIAERNAVLAEHALDEAREIRASTPELDNLLKALERLQNEQGPNVRKRAVGAVALFAAGVSMFVLLDATRITNAILPVVAPPPPAARGAAMVPPLRRDSVVLDEPVFSEQQRAEEPGSTSRPVQPPPALSTRRASADTGTRDIRAPRPTVDASEGRANASNKPTITATEVEHEKVPDPPSIDVLSAPRRMGPTPALAVASAPPDVVTAANIVPPARVDRAAVDQSAVADVLRRYAAAYGDLDVRAAREIWPNVDQRALARAFDGLASQTVSFDDCQIDVDGVTASASCRGRASYVGKVGRGEPRTEPRMWRFELKREGEAWKIANAEARRTSG